MKGKSIKQEDVKSQKEVFLSKFDIVQDHIADNLTRIPYYKFDQVEEEPKGLSNLGNTCFLNSSV